MEKHICLLACTLALTPLTSVFCQPPPSSPPLPMRLPPGYPSSKTEDTNPLSRFDIDFPGGSPAQLVIAIQRSTEKPLNAIIPTEDADVQLPPLKMNDVTVPQLFTALEAASHKNISVISGGFNGFPAQEMLSYGFKTSDNPAKDSSIWYFHAEKPTRPPVVTDEKVCRFYSLAPYLDRGFSVDDITTAIQTGWKMSGVLAAPELKYHKETKLLIAFGEPDKLATIESVLRTLPTSNATRAELDTMHRTIETLQQQEKITRDLALTPRPVPLAPVTPPEEKPGK